MTKIRLDIDIHELAYNLYSNLDWEPYGDFINKSLLNITTPCMSEESLKKFFDQFSDEVKKFLLENLREEEPPKKEFTPEEIGEMIYYQDIFPSIGKVFSTFINKWQYENYAIKRLPEYCDPHTRDFFIAIGKRCEELQKEEKKKEEIFYKVGDKFIYHTIDIYKGDPNPVNHDIYEIQAIDDELYGLVKIQNANVQNHAAHSPEIWCGSRKIPNPEKITEKEFADLSSSSIKESKFYFHQIPNDYDPQKKEVFYHVGQYFYKASDIYQLQNTSGNPYMIKFQKVHDTFYTWRNGNDDKFLRVNNPHKITEKEFKIIRDDDFFFTPISKEEALEKLKTLD